MAQRQRRWRADITGPGGAKPDDFVGVDGANPTLNSARLQINLKPLDARDDRVQQVISGCKPPWQRFPAWRCISSRRRI
ncbi:hypothetical protein JS565_08620 [Salmonella enterica subsp. enterica serovar Senftenberg]|nr:hypothetical protein [Salmonella enterica subsp. enterica serovar Senftenberg]